MIIYPAPIVIKNIAATQIKSMSAFNTLARRLFTFPRVPSQLSSVQNGEKVATDIVNPGLAIPQAVVASPACTVLSFGKLLREVRLIRKIPRKIHIQVIIRICI